MLSTTKKAESIRDVIHYLQKFKNALTVIYLDEKTIASPLFSSHIRDIALLHQAGLQVLIIPGARSRIDQVLSSANISWTYKDNSRICPPEAMPFIKMAAFDVSNTVMTSLAANNITAIIGNWVRARGKGIIDGFDYGNAGEIDKLDTSSLKTVLNEGFIPIFPCIGWNSAGHPYNISSVTLAQQIAIELKADKLFFVMDDVNLNSSTYKVPDGVALDETGEIAAMDLEQVDTFIMLNKGSEEVVNLLNLAKNACQKGVTRVHLVDGKIDGVLPTEIFSNLGSGTMIYTSNYGKIRQMEQNDIPSVLAIMRPFVEKGKLLPRTEQELKNTFTNYIVYEIDSAIHACSSLFMYKDGQSEIAAVAVDEAFSHMGIGPKLIKALIAKAKSQGSKSVFIMTTQAADWFEKLGFKESTIDSIPEERRKKWSEKRNSKVYRL
ncbi:MAG: amino-acid N-acetyltransferase [Treponema sp.]|nr:amino-acid N-acetyltransferase [Treponema sp.]